MPIAIIGLACRFSGENEDSSSPEKLWDMLEKGQSGWSKGFGERFNQDSFYHPVQENDGTVWLRLFLLIAILELCNLLIHSPMSKEPTL